MPEKPTIAYIVAGSDGAEIKSQNPDKPMESSSTIKIPIILLALQAASQRSHDTSHRLARHARHASTGSGILNWTKADHISLHDLLLTTLIYSDCLATNMLLDYIGGQAAVNQWLEREGYITRLHMPYLYFEEPDTSLPHVGTTTARELAELFQRLMFTAWPDQFKRLINQATASVHESWFELNSPIKLIALRHKTGSMIDSGPDGETVLNAAGDFKKAGREYTFALLSHGRLRGRNNVSAEQLKQFVAGQLTAALEV